MKIKLFAACLFFGAAACSLLSAEVSTTTKALTNAVPVASGSNLIARLYLHTNEMFGAYERFEAVMGAWQSLVKVGAGTTNIQTQTTVFAGIAPSSSTIIDRLGKPEMTSKLPVKSIVQLDGKTPVPVHFMWYGALGLGCFGDKPDDTMIAIAYDPKRDKR